MKKFILTLATVLVLVCAFAMVISAANFVYVDEATGEELFRCTTSGTTTYPITSYSGKGFARYNADGEALTWYYVSDEVLETGEKQYTVASAKTKTLVVDDGDGILKSSEITKYNHLVSITFDEDCGITEFSKAVFHKTTNSGFFLFAHVPDSVTKLGDSCFRNCYSLIEIEISEKSQLTDMGAASFFGATSLRNIYIPKGVSVLKTEFTSQKYWENGFFRNCQKLENVIFAEDSSLELLEKGTFNYCDSLKTITLPNSVKTIQPRVFAHCPALEYVNFGGGLERIVRIEGDSDEYVSLFQYADNLKTVVLPATFKAENLADNLHTTFAIKGITVYYAGTEAEFIKLQEKFAKATVGSGNKGITQATYNYINPCEAFYKGNHEKTADEDNNCSFICERCNFFLMLENPVHTESLKLMFGTYIDEVEEITETVNYYGNMYVLHVCKYCDAEMGDTENYGSMFENKGMSASLDETVAITFSVYINYKTIAKYEEITEKQIEYGLIVSAAPSNTPITGTVDGKIQMSENSVSLDMTGAGYSKIDVKITNIVRNQELNCAGYVLNGGNITYLNYDSAVDKAEILSYDVILEKTGDEE